MGPTEEDEFVAAENIWAAGETNAAVQMYVDLSHRAQNPDVRLRSALALIEKLNPGWYVSVILDACSTGIEMAEKLGDAETKVYLMSTRAQNLAIFNGSLITARKNLKLAPKWLGFSLERDEQQYKELTARIVANDEEADQLARDALDESGNGATLGHVLLSIGNISFQRYMSMKTECLRHSISLPSFIRGRLRTSTLDEYCWYRAFDRRAMRRLLEECERQHCKAAAAFSVAGDELNVACTFYSLANDLRTANRFRKAKRYLKQAEIIAKRRKDETLLSRISILNERIRHRNKNVPNYVAGEGQRID